MEIDSQPRTFKAPSPVHPMKKYQEIMVSLQRRAHILLWTDVIDSESRVGGLWDHVRRKYDDEYVHGVPAVSESYTVPSKHVTSRDCHGA